MIYLVVKIVLSLALAALCGGLLGHWWVRRRSIDVTEEYTQLASAVRSLRGADLGPVEQRLHAIELRLRPVDLGPLEDRIDRLQQQLDALRVYLERTPAPAPPLAMPPRSGNGKTLLEKASFGPPDDLQRIRGIGPVLNRLLHRVGVFYFWQIAEWTEEDVAFVNGKLDVFKGRIERELWVEQAARLAHGPDTAKPPSARRAAPEHQPSAVAP